MAGHTEGETGIWESETKGKVFQGGSTVSKAEQSKRLKNKTGENNSSEGEKSRGEERTYSKRISEREGEMRD